MRIINGLNKKEQKKLARLETEFDAAGGRGVDLANLIDILQERRDAPNKVAEVYESLVVAANEKSEINLSPFAVSVVITMINFRSYRTKVRKWHEQIYG